MVKSERYIDYKKLPWKYMKYAFGSQTKGHNIRS